MNPLLNYKIFSLESPVSQKQIPLLILHGLLGAMDNWRSQTKRIAVTRPVITVDLRNHGDSPHVKGMSYREMAEDIIALARHENIASFDLLGHSMGGKVAMQLALNYSEQINRLIVVDIAPKTYPLWHQETLQVLIKTPLQRLHTRQEINDFLSDWIEDRTERAFMLKNLKRAKETSKQTYQWRCNIPEISRNYLKIAGFSKTTRQYAKKTLFIKGANSSYIEDTDGALIESLFPNASVVSIKNSGHLPHIEQADAFFDQLNAFLSID
ncbi:MAG TPA: alpha/beta fold hydrolase [Leucothrix mucor]|nr:alpha/beta fold hydrolase [Leucothrix mucor]